MPVEFPDLTALELVNLGQVHGELRALIQARRDAGTFPTHMGAEVGRGKSYVRHFMAAGDALGWHWTTLHSLAQIAGRRAGIVFDGLPESQDPMWLMGLENPAFLGIGAISMLKAVRDDLGISQRQVAEFMGVVHSNIWKMEESGDPKLHSIMRYARAVGGSARYRLEKP